MTASIPPAEADEAGRLAELSAKALEQEQRRDIGAAWQDLSIELFRIACVDAYRAGRLVPATPTADERSDLSGVQVYVIGNDKFVTLDAHEAACAIYEAERASLVPATPTQSKDPRAAFNRLMDADATPTPPAPSRDLVEALTDARDTLQGLQAWLPDDFPTDALIAVHEAIAGADAALAATQAPAEPSQGAEAAEAETRETLAQLETILGVKGPANVFRAALRLSQSAGGR